MRADLYGLEGIPPQRAAARPGNVAGATFPLVRRGYDPTQVNWYLQGLAEDLADHEERRSSLELQVAQLQKELAGVSRIDEISVANFLGEESTRLLFEAREMSSRLVAKSEDRASKILAAARTTAQDALTESERDAKRMRREAEEETTRLRRDTKAETSRQLKESETDGRKLRRDTEASAALLRAETEATCNEAVAGAQSHAANLVAEAEARRTEILSDLHERETKANARLAELLVGRDALMATLAHVSATAHALTVDLSAHAAVPDAARDLADAAQAEAVLISASDRTVTTAEIVARDIDSAA